MFISRKGLVLTSTAVALLSACGGGGGGGSAPAATTPPTSTTEWVKGQFSPPTTFAALCVTPRTGIDPATHATLPRPPGHRA